MELGAKNCHLGDCQKSLADLGWEILSDFCPQGSPIDYGRAPMGRLCVCDAIISNDILSVLCLQPLFKTFTSNNST